MAILTTEGKQWIIDKLQNIAPNTDANCNVVGWGTGNAAEALGLTFGSAGITEAAENRATGTLSQSTAVTDRLVATMTATGNRNITQVWRTNITTKGSGEQRMFIYALYTAVPVETGDSIEFTIDYVQS